MKIFLFAISIAGLFMAACPSGGTVSVAVPSVNLKVKYSFKTAVDEPSDVALSADGKSFFIVSDDGILYQTDLEGKILKKAPFEATDFEGCYANADKVFVVDERTRLVHTFDQATLERELSIEVPYMGGRNKGFKSFTYNAEKQRYLLITEKDPTIVFELDAAFQVKDRVTIKVASDLSSATFNKGKLYLLSDEEHTVFEVNPTNYQVIRKWVLPVINPEGINFLPDGRLVILSDDAGTIYYFDPIN